MAGWTNRGKYRNLLVFYRHGSIPTNLFIALATSAVEPVVDTNTLGQLTEIAEGNGYTAGGYSLTRDGTDFDVLTEDDANDRALVQVKDVVWTATGGSIPASGGGARYAVMTDDNATLASRDVLHFWSLNSGRVISTGQTLTLQNLEMRLTE